MNFIEEIPLIMRVILITICVLTMLYAWFLIDYKYFRIWCGDRFAIDFQFRNGIPLFDPGFIQVAPTSSGDELNEWFVGWAEKQRCEIEIDDIAINLQEPEDGPARIATMIDYRIKPWITV